MRVSEVRRRRAEALSDWPSMVAVFGSVTAEGVMSSREIEELAQHLARQGKPKPNCELGG
jgi:hypothetical protein